MPKLPIKRPKPKPTSAPVVADRRRPVHMIKDLKPDTIETRCGVRMSRKEANAERIVLTVWEASVTCPRCKLSS